MAGKSQGSQVILLREGRAVTRFFLDLPAGMLVEEILSGKRHFRRFGTGETLTAWQDGDLVYIQVGDRQSSPVSASPGAKRQRQVSNPHGTVELTERQSEVLEGLIKGQKLAEIAFHLGIRLRSVRHHVDALKQKSGAVSLSQLSAKALAAGWVTSTPPQGGPGAGRRRDHPKKHFRRGEL